MGLNELFNPKSIAIVGVSHEPHKVGYLVAKNLLEQGYKGDVYFINNKFKGKILGKKVYASLQAIPTYEVGKSAIELVVLAVPADVALFYFEEMKKLNIKNAVIYAAGFKEIGDGGLKREELLLKKAKEYGITILGPNCIGYVNTVSGINVTFLKDVCPEGTIGLISQSGALASMMVDHYNAHHNLGFSYIISLGNKSILDESDALEFLANDKNTRVIAMYLEDVKNGTKFKQTIQTISKTKPIIILKSGTTSEGSKAALSHTGGMVGNDQVYDSVFKQYGVIRATNMTEFLTMLKILSFKRSPVSNNILVLSNAGGIGVLMADEIIKNDLHLVTISNKTKKELEKGSERTNKITVHNPIDLLGDASAFDYGNAIEATVHEKDVGAVIILLTPQANTEIKETATVIARAQKNCDKPIYPLFMGEKSTEGSHLFFEDQKIASFYKYDYLPQSLVKILRWKENAGQETFVHSPHLLKLSLMANEEEIIHILKASEKKPYLDLVDSMDILHYVDIPTAPFLYIEKNADVKKFVHKVGFPCVLKVVSDSITHKTEVGGVITNINSIQELERAEIYLRKIGEIKGFFAQRMEKGFEMFIGAKRDPQFGIVLVTGLGGIYTELLKEVAFRIYPFSYDEFLYMISETKVSKLIRGFRGSKVIEARKIYDVIMKIGLLMEYFPVIKEIDMNPLIISDTSISAVDCRIIL